MAISKNELKKHIVGASIISVLAQVPEDAVTIADELRRGGKTVYILSGLNDFNMFAIDRSHVLVVSWPQSEDSKPIMDYIYRAMKSNCTVICVDVTMSDIKKV